MTELKLNLANVAATKLEVLCDEESDTATYLALKKEPKQAFCRIRRDGKST